MTPHAFIIKIKIQIPSIILELIRVVLKEVETEMRLPMKNTDTESYVHICIY
jgi:hypothetical protein